MNFALLENLGRPRHALFVGHEVVELAGLLRGRINEVVALESSQDALERTAGLTFEKHLLSLSSAHPLQAVDGRQFDLVVLEGSVERTGDARRLLEQAHARLVDGGHLIISVAADAGLSRDAVRRSLGDAGFEVMRSELKPRFFRQEFARTAKVIDDLRLTQVPLFSALGHLARPVERAIAWRDPDRRAAEHLWIARRRPLPAPLTLTVGMLTLNEVESIERMINDIRAVVPDAKILVIDSSSDQTPELARAMGARVIRQLPPQGHGPAMERLMYEAAQETEALIYLDCDFTYPTNMIPFIRQLLEDGADVVNGSRTARYPKAMPFANFLANRFMAASTHLAHGVPTTDVHSGMRGYRCSVIRGFSFDGSGDALPLDTLILPARSGYEVVEFPIAYDERVGVSKLAKVRGLLWTYLRLAGALRHGERVARNSPHYVLKRDGVVEHAQARPPDRPE
jgi:SAM-dependent methyltransferase